MRTKVKPLIVDLFEQIRKVFIYLPFPVIRKKSLLVKFEDIVVPKSQVSIAIIREQTKNTIQISIKELD